MAIPKIIGAAVAKVLSGAFRTGGLTPAARRV